MRVVSTLIFFSILLQACDQQEKSTKTPLPPVDSIAIIKEQLSKNATDPVLWKSLYELEIEKGDTAQALISLQNYTQLVPEDGNGWLELAWLFADARDPRVLIITDSLKTVKDPEISSRAAYIGGVYYSNMGQDERAVKIFDSLIINNYSFLDAYIEKGIIQHDRKQYAEALKTFQQAMKVNSSTAEIYFWISKCYEGLGEQAEAEDWRKKYEALR